MRVDPGANGSAAQRQLSQMRFDAAQTLDAVSDLAGVTAEFLAEPDRRRILQMRPADLENVVELPRLFRERGLQFLECGNEPARDAFKRGDVDGGRNDVVARL